MSLKIVSSVQRLPLSDKVGGVVSLPGSTSRGSEVNRADTPVEETTMSSSSCSLTAHFTMLVLGEGDPSNLRIVTDSLVVGIYKDDFEPFVQSILTNPVGAQKSQVSASLTDTSLSNNLEVSGGLQAGNTMTSGLTVGSTLGDLLFASSSPDTDSVDNVSLLGTVSKTMCLVRTCGLCCTNNGGELSIFPATKTEQETESVRLLLSVKDLEVFVSTYLICQ
jgi:hypothetical protein